MDENYAVTWVSILNWIKYLKITSRLHKVSASDKINARLHRFKTLLNINKPCLRWKL